MIMKFLRENVYAASLITVLRLYIGWQWLTAGWGKVTEGFSAEGYLFGVVGNEAVLEQYPRYHTFIEHVALPNADTFSFMVAWGELLVGLGLLLGVLTTAAAFFGLMMNLSFLFAGTISSNPWMILLTIFISVAGANAGRFGGDRYVLPFIREKLQKNRLGQKSSITSSDKLAS
ncbi:DoxX family protein [Halalkalibacterium halodurans]|uniref:DoxX family protein n=1 Tax=Halalkalibacterium halodurans TaxID=86665 RepID=UPI002E22C37D|nr:DoxX family protein [Halalkalibacterium halodurans]MED4085146.1 DoxX family protein [Halalkalibacterium halodurans]MED4105276.1 DoxX family protein [Halalkalibacterium halodurans]MED4109085.1 DoxX family protein [Halalkalibacterium halodurans]MED4149005.1 DoxX family protein [Halalkalibacterium halodurans]